ncbi:unnamed protein product [Rotaria sp. Silwood2]|nr:unnamed protein product [Rotaria sp. Silwood2]CAF4323686.1 unnamed protein product [Rotaria sp. Silwood2]
MQFIGIILLLVIGSEQISSSLFGQQIIQGLGANTPFARGIFEQTCSKLYDLMAFPRKYVAVEVLTLSPLRIRSKVEITHPASGCKDQFFVKVHAYQNDFDQYAADAVFRSLKQGVYVGVGVDMDKRSSTPTPTLPSSRSQLFRHVRSESITYSTQQNEHHKPRAEYVAWSK